MSLLEIALTAAIALAVLLALRRVFRLRKSGGCSCGCADCSAACKQKGHKQR